LVYRKLVRKKLQATKFIPKARGKKYIHFLHIGKTGGTAVKYALRSYTETDKYLLKLHGHHTRLRNVPEKEYVIFFLRDPISRFVSAFYSRKRQGRPRHDMPWKPGEQEVFERYATPNQLALALSSVNEEERASAVSAMWCVQHIKESYWDWFENEAYFRSRQSDIFFVGFQECLQAHFELLRLKLELPSEVQLPTDDVQAHRNSTDVDRSLHETAILNLKNWYQADYRFIKLCQEMFDHLTAHDFASGAC